MLYYAILYFRATLAVTRYAVLYFPLLRNHCRGLAMPSTSRCSRQLVGAACKET